MPKPHNGARDERPPQAADAPQAHPRRSGAERSGAGRAAPGFRSIEQIGGGEVALATSRRRCSMASRAPIGEMRAPASVSPIGMHNPPLVVRYV